MYFENHLLYFTYFLKFPEKYPFFRSILKPHVLVRPCDRDDTVFKVMTVFSGRRGSPASTSRSWPLLQPAAPACRKEGWGKTGFLASGHMQSSHLSQVATQPLLTAQEAGNVWMTFLLLQERKDILGSQQCGRGPRRWMDLVPWPQLFMWERPGTNPTQG